MRATVQWLPERDGPLVTLKPCWCADNGYETAVFATKDEAVAFCRKRWRVPADEVRILAAPTEEPEWETLRSDVRELKDALARRERALRFYALPEAYTTNVDGRCSAVNDGGQLARAALRSREPEKSRLNPKTCPACGSDDPQYRVVPRCGHVWHAAAAVPTEEP